MRRLVVVIRICLLRNERRVGIDAFHPSAIEWQQRLKRFEVVALNQ
jgi:hypothetical protein